jgi:nucleotide-binding universal stress UspA family protein
MVNLNKILFTTDFSECAMQAFPHALYLAERYEAQLYMLHAIVIHRDDPYNPAYQFDDLDDIERKLKEHANERVQEMIKKMHAENIYIIKEHKRGFAPAEVILEYAQDNDMDLIVIGTHGRRGLGHLFLGSVAEEVVRLSTCPVLTIREKEKPQPVDGLEKILFPIDFSNHSRVSLAHAKYLAQEYEARLILLHVVEETVHPAFYASGKKSIFDLMPDIKDKSTKLMGKFFTESEGPEVDTEMCIVEGSAAREIVRFVDDQQIDLIVIATHGLTGIDHFLLGSVTEKVVRQASCPVFTVKSFGKSLL